MGASVCIQVHEIHVVKIEVSRNVIIEGRKDAGQKIFFDIREQDRRNIGLNLALYQDKFHDQLYLGLVR